MLVDTFLLTDSCLFIPSHLLFYNLWYFNIFLAERGTILLFWLNMASSPASFSDIGKRAKGILDLKQMFNYIVLLSSFWTEYLYNMGCRTLHF